MSQTNLAEKLNMKPQQIQRYEASAYKGASLAKLIEIADTLSVKLKSRGRSRETDKPMDRFFDGEIAPTSRGVNCPTKR